MKQNDSYRRTDPLLVPFLHTTDEREANQHLDRLIAHAAPGISRITKSSRTPDDAFQEASHRLVRQLRQLRAERQESAIGNYLHYVKVVASRVVKGQVRQEHPKHRSLVDALRHVLRNDPSFALWQQGACHKLCGLVAWHDQHETRIQSERLTRLLDEPRAFEDVVSLPQDVMRLNHAELLRLLFEWIGHPIRFKELAKIVCGLKRIEDATPVADREDGRGLSEWLPDKRPRPDEGAEWKEFLQRLWAQIEQLPGSQRLAYLLNFTAADGQIELFWTYGVASIRRIGSVLQITDQQFDRVWSALTMSDETRHRVAMCANYDERFATLWQYLPLTDAVIASMLGMERQKVINLRKAASDRLSRRMVSAKSPNLASC